MLLIIRVLFVLAIVLLSLPVSAQLVRQGGCLTIPEGVAMGSISSVGHLPSGLAPTVADLLRDSDVLVMGTIGTPHSYLSDDQCDVYTDFPINEPVVFYYRYASEMTTTHNPAMLRNVVVTQLGGTVTVTGKKFTQKEPAQLEPGTQALLLLRRVGDKYLITRRFYGVFRITNDELTPLIEDFAAEYRNMKVSDGVDRMMKLLGAQRPRD